MQEEKKSLLKTLVRLWFVPMVLCIALCIIGTIACINEHRGIMALAALGTIPMLIIMVCQLIASIFTRQWWCLGGAIFGIAISLFVMLCSIVALAAGQYRPPMRQETHNISDIMLIIADQEDPGELLSYIRTAWEQYTQGEEYPGEFTLQDDYLMYIDRNEDEERGFVWTDTTEFRSWDFESSPYKLVAMAHRDYRNGKLICGQYSGLSLYIYDGDTIEWITIDTLGLEYPEIDGLITYTLSGNDADLTMTVNNPEEGSCTKSFEWDGNKFVKQSQP